VEEDVGKRLPPPSIPTWQGMRLHSLSVHKQCVARSTKKNPRIIKNDPGMPWFIRVSGGSLPLSTGRRYARIQAGLLTPGSSLRRAFPISISGVKATFVPGYSGGPVSDLHGVPFYSEWNLNSQHNGIVFVVQVKGYFCSL